METTQTPDTPLVGHCKRKILLLRGQEFFIPAKDLLDNLAGYICRNAEDESHVDRMIYTWIGRTRQMLHPSDVAALARETATRPILPAACEKCAGMYYVMVEENGGLVAIRCGCDRGAALSALDIKRRASERISG